MMGQLGACHRAGSVAAPDRAGDKPRAGDRAPRAGVGTGAGALTAALAFENRRPKTRLPPAAVATASAWAISGTKWLRCSTTCRAALTLRRRETFCKQLRSAA